MGIRRKLRKFLFIAFIAILTIKIHYDYQIINSIQNGNSKNSLIYNGTHPNEIITLIEVQDVISLVNNQSNLIQRKLSSADWKISGHPSGDRGLKNGVDSINFSRNGSSGSTKVQQKVVPMSLVNPLNDSRLSSSVMQINTSLTKTTELVNSQTVTESQEKKFTTKSNGKGKDSKEKVNISAHSRSKLTPEEVKKKIISLRDILRVNKMPKGKVNNIAVSHNIDAAECSLNETEIKRIKKEISNINEEQVIHNLKKFGPLLPNDTVILIQVHNRLENLRYLVQSLTEVKNIASTLVIFSHDLWDDAINVFVKNITQFRVMQIFFPFSIQLNPKNFPGRDPRDCVWNQGRVASNPSGQQLHVCLNQKWPDTFGHYREAAFTQIKHHWWWKIIRVYDNLRETKNFPGQVLFLEEDHYVAPDLLHVLRLLLKIRSTLNSSAFVLALGNYQKYSGTAKNLVDVGDWIVNKYNIGFSLDRKTFDLIRNCSQTFCNFDDYNWDWTLTNVEKSCVPNRLLMLSLKLSRVYHIGSCGTHVRRANCNLPKEVGTTQNRIRGSQTWFFPEELVLQKTFRKMGKPMKSNGGWGDYRDRQLCLAIGNGTASEQTIERLQFN